jgi:hypothetical protein
MQKSFYVNYSFLEVFFYSVFWNKTWYRTTTINFHYLSILITHHEQINKPTKNDSYRLNNYFIISLNSSLK